MSNASLGLMMVIAGLVAALFTPWVARSNVELTRRCWRINAGGRAERLFRLWGFFVSTCLVVGGVCLIIFF